MSLQGRNALVTGSTSGIGLAIAHVLADKGCNIVVNGLGDKATIESIVAELMEKYKVKVMYSDADVSKAADIRRMVADANIKFGGVDILINNAGVQFTALVERFPEEEWDRIIAINLSAAFHSIKATIPLMKKNSFGRIINIASVHGLIGSTSKAAYVAAKHGVVGLTKVVALEQADAGITCNAVCPGWVDTQLVQTQIEKMAKTEGISYQEAKDKLLSAKQPNKRFIRPESLGEFIALICTDHGEAMTGEIFAVDGGWTAQ